jgi:hypothetical protein
MAAAVTQNTNDQRLAREEKAAKQEEPKLPSDRFNVTLHILQEYLQIADEMNLPPLWQRLANCTKRQDFNVLLEQLQSYARGPEAFSACAPIASAKLAQDLINFVFVSESTDDIRTGIQPFIIADASAEHRQANLELARMYGLLSAGDHSVLLTDLQALQSKEVQFIPLTYFELERNLGMFGNLLGTVLGSTHVITEKYHEFWTLLSLSYRQELQQLIDVKQYIKPAHVLCSIQLVCYNWYAQCRARLTPPMPDFTCILYNIMLNTYVLPNLPPLLYKMAYQKSALATPSLSGTSGTPSSSSTTSSLVSSIMMPPPACQHLQRHANGAPILQT